MWSFFSVLIGAAADIWAQRRADKAKRNAEEKREREELEELWRKENGAP